MLRHYCCFFTCRISEEDFEVLAGNLQLLVVHQREVFDKMHETVERDVNNAKIGGILLRAAPLLRQLLRFYCENHPKAVDLILQNRLPSFAFFLGGGGGGENRLMSQKY